MNFPHRRHGASLVTPLIGVGSEPYGLFFLRGILQCIAGVLLWPLFYQGKLAFYPGISRAHLMSQVFGGSYVIGDHSYTAIEGDMIGLSIKRLFPQTLGCSTRPHARSTISPHGGGISRRRAN